VALLLRRAYLAARMAQCFREPRRGRPRPARYGAPLMDMAGPRYSLRSAAGPSTLSLASTHRLPAAQGEPVKGRGLVGAGGQALDLNRPPTPSPQAAASAYVRDLSLIVPAPLPRRPDVPERPRALHSGGTRAAARPAAGHAAPRMMVVFLSSADLSRRGSWLAARGIRRGHRRRRRRRPPGTRIRRSVEGRDSTARGVDSSLSSGGRAICPPRSRC